MTGGWDMKAIFGALAIAMLAGCSSGDESDGRAANRLNSCATRNATYIQTCVEASGNCGPMPDQVVNTDAAGAAAIESARCESVAQDGCTARATGCAYESTAPAAKQMGGCTIAETYSTTFAQDGSSASSVATVRIDCGDGSWCQSTYKCSIVRQ